MQYNYINHDAVQQICQLESCSEQSASKYIFSSFHSHNVSQMTSLCYENTYIHILNTHNVSAQVLLVSSSRHPDKWIVPGGGMEPEEEPNVAAAREVCEEVEH